MTDVPPTSTGCWRDSLRPSGHSTAPTLTTARLTLSAHTVSDFENVAALWADPDVVRFIGPPSSRTASWQRLLRYAGHWALLGFGFWAVRETASGRFVGEVGLADFHRPLAPPLEAPEAGWVLAPWAHGQGYGAEAVAAALDWAERHIGLQRSQCLIAPDNEPSVKLAKRLGYREARLADLEGEEVVVRERISTVRKIVAS